MKSFTASILFLLLFTATSFSQTLSSDRLVYEWKNMKDMVVNTAIAMPQEFYDNKPVEGLKSFADQVKHITTSNRFFIGYLVGENNNDLNKKTLENIKGKDAIIKDLEQSFDYVIQTLPKMKNFDEQIDMFGQKLTRFEALMNTEHHLQREYGKIIVYVRLKGVAPAKSASWLK